jgi:hypothetical protein
MRANHHFVYPLMASWAPFTTCVIREEQIGLELSLTK